MLLTSKSVLAQELAPLKLTQITFLHPIGSRCLWLQVQILAKARRLRILNSLCAHTLYNWETESELLEKPKKTFPKTFQEGRKQKGKQESVGLKFNSAKIEFFHKR